ncbi:oxygen-dependent coproporphyrinogen-III oxidase, chloroplastic-like isoform X2 [Lycium ferocissimum]|uniref:oxygen-dependent coproporphyrinogen-III oxidase, chloroplastic-like isoform X2 n=1 Tax=Lycium ferocissimum TaxID=112874 RepID=UPI0028155F26|nr:oxygen-dependent coproporphyrinogen-III oxidase, chloroplastic-like isoform X2 [Lycium ferocissimum]
MLPSILSSPSSSTFPLKYSIPSSSFTTSSPLLPPLTIRYKSSKRPKYHYSLKVQASSSSSRMIERETPETERPHTFLRESDEGDDSSKSNSVRARFEKMIREVQDSVCSALEAVDGGAKFKEDVWSRPGGGGGISRVLQDGVVFEKAGVNVSVVYGTMPPEAYRAARPVDNGNAKPGPIPFFAAGVSSVLHPKNPFAPTVHFNYRYFETDAPKDAPGAPRQWWFGGGTDLTPAYIFEEDVKHFHSVQKGACDKFDASFYPRFKKWCDDYFYIKHRGERRGLGGIFFDDLNDYDQEMLLSFSTECANSVIPAYIPIVEKRKDTPFNDEHKAWQQLRRGRYVEFNLVYDRGTTFGLKTGGRIESILVSLPLTARWEYDHQPVEGSEEWKLLDACINPKEWIC